MHKSKLFRVVLTVIGGPAAGAFGVWLLSEAPLIHRAICSPGFWPMDPTIIAGGLKLIGGLFGRKKSKPMTPAQSIMSTAQGVTDASKATGLNRLTLLGASNATAGAGIEMGGGPAPLASLSILGDIIEDKYGDEANTRREHNKLQNELLRLEVDRARGMIALPAIRSAADGGQITGPWNGTKMGSYSGGYLTEADRNAAMADERDNTVSFQSHGQQTVVPVGPDLDEILTGVLIDASNRRKARLAREARSPGMTVGSPLQIAPGAQPVAGLLPTPAQKPSGYTADGRPFWTMPDGSLRWSYP